LHEKAFLGKGREIRALWQTEIGQSHLARCPICFEINNREVFCNVKKRKAAV